MHYRRTQLPSLLVAPRVALEHRVAGLSSSLLPLRSGLPWLPKLSRLALRLSFVPDFSPNWLSLCGFPFRLLSFLPLLLLPQLLTHCLFQLLSIHLALEMLLRLSPPLPIVLLEAVAFLHPFFLLGAGSNSLLFFFDGVLLTTDKSMGCISTLLL